MSEQETMFSQLWSDPIESFFTQAGAPSDLEMFNKILYQFVTEMSAKLQHVSKVKLHQFGSSKTNKTKSLQMQQKMINIADDDRICVFDFELDGFFYLK